ncbi:hypothetical protein TTHERM_00348260 (macronuclear) [Tetrahymena thermophila SB210]|uniref:Uncharacterized protein n=1 Tax=Tetrahymena thermophila (strain SB210) TaxID=312017 RepID=I7MH99_TETTS|nr:hypothetical protein TTHERM_00348260 [Tetrahymena thermophila SB210]EAS02736.2 hypothetical protein TTHERM_00348260 [Tetrahymena thermophila SB210]|eukprot:XP_001022981.2 hypothetical protein TTHERM_00348260 [Tetrahymena thermophila SB210]
MKPNREAVRNIRVLSQTSGNQDLNRQSLTNHPNQNNNSMNIVSNNINTSQQNNSSFAHTSGDASTSINTRPNNSSSVNKSNAAPHSQQNQLNYTNGFSAAADNPNKTQTSLSPFSNKNTRVLKETANNNQGSQNTNPIHLINSTGGISFLNGQPQLQQQQQSLLSEQMKKLKEDLQRKERIKKMQQEKLAGSIVVGQQMQQNTSGNKQTIQQSQQQQQRNSHQHIQQIIQHQQQQLQQQQQPPPKQDFRKEIERRFQRSNVNKTFIFPRKKRNGNLNTISGGEPVESNNSSSDSSLDSIKDVTVYDLRSQNNKINSLRRVQRSTTDHSLGGTRPLVSDSPEIKNTQNQNNINNQSISQFNKNSYKQQQTISSSSQQVKTEGDEQQQSQSNNYARTHSSISKPVSMITQQHQQQAILNRENQQFSSLNQKLLGSVLVGQQLQKNDSSVQQPFSQTNGFLSNSNTKPMKRGEIAKSANKSYDHKIQNASTTFTTIQSKSSNSRRPQQSQGFDNTKDYQESITNPRYATEFSPEKKSNISDFLNNVSIQNNQSSINYDSYNRQHSKSQSGNKINNAQVVFNKNQVSLSKNGARNTQNNMRIFQMKNDQLQKIYKSNIKRNEYQQNNLSQDNYSAMRVQTEGSEPQNKNNIYNKQELYKKFKVSQVPQQNNLINSNVFSSQQQQMFNQNNISFKKQKLPVLQQ